MTPETWKTIKIVVGSFLTVGAITICIGVTMLSNVLNSMSSAQNKLADGLYLSMRNSSDKTKIEPLAHDEALLVNDFHYFEEKEPTQYYALKKAPFVPMSLGRDPSVGEDDKGKAKLLLQLDEANTSKLEDFTRKNAGRTVAIVIGGEVITAHKIREPIVGGKLQITWCTGNACKAIHSQLTKHRN